jgi:hypothetical protein
MPMAFLPGAPVGANYYEATAGAAIKPFPKDKFLSKFLLRPGNYQLATHNLLKIKVCSIYSLLVSFKPPCKFQEVFLLFLDKCKATNPSCKQKSLPYNNLN